MTSLYGIFPEMPLLANATGGTGALVTFLLYSLATFVLALVASGMLSKKSFLSEYFLGSRGLGVIAFTLTFGATSASAGSFGGFPSLVYAHGWVVAVWIAGYMVVPLCGMGLFGKRLNQVARKSGSITLPDVLRDRFQSPAVAIVATLLLIFLLSFYLIPQFKIAAIILRTLLADVPLMHNGAVALAQWTQDIPFFASADAEYLLCLFMFALITIAYTTFGGFRAVVWTDVLQGFVMIFGVVCMLVLALWQVGGLNTATEKMARMTTPRLGVVVFESTEPVSQAGVRIPSDFWLHADDPQTGERLLLRTNEVAVIANGQTASGPTKVVHITTPEEIAEIEARLTSSSTLLPEGVTPRIEKLEEYQFGANQPGVYVQGPGPSFDTLVGFLPMGVAFSFFIYWPLSGAGQPGNMLRLMAFDSSRTLSRSISLLAVYFSLIYFPIVLIFCCARLLIPGLDQDPDRIMPEMAFSLSHGAGVPWLAGLLVAAPFAAAMSTVDSLMLMISSSVVRDVYQRSISPQASEAKIKRISYLCTLIVGVAATLGAVNPPQFLQYLIVFTGGGLSVCFLIPMAMTLYWPRANTPGVLAAMLGGLAVYLGFYVTGFLLYQTTKPVTLLSLDPLVWGLLASLLFGVIVTKLTKPVPEELVRKFFYAD